MLLKKLKNISITNIKFKGFICNLKNLKDLFIINKKLKTYKCILPEEIFFFIYKLHALVKIFYIINL
jgi:hypothetical protein